MEKKSFNLLKILPNLREELKCNVQDGLNNLQTILRMHRLQGFEFELIGRLLKDVCVNDELEVPKQRVAVLANYTSEPIANAVRIAFLLEGILADVYEAPFRGYKQEIIDANSDLYKFNPNMIIIAVSLIDRENLPSSFMTDSEVDMLLEERVYNWQMLWNLLNKKLGKPILQHVFEVPEEEILGVAERQANWSWARFTELLNNKLINLSPSFVKWIDTDRLAARVGRQNWHDVRLYYHGKFGFSSCFLPEYTSLLLSSVREALAKTKKALILDLDNTLWGGTIGDDGLDGIKLGLDTTEGEAYLSFCNYVKELGKRGVILGICSKNEFSIAKEVFEKHSYMPLKLNDFAVIRCNWTDKATNLIDIAQELNIDISSIVFADDNHAECELIRQTLPAVHVIHMDGEPAFFIRKLDHQHLFDSAKFSTEDINRTASYKARAKAIELQAAAPDIETYLLSLEMQATIVEAGINELPRLAQMELKTNQFNLSTHRLSSAQLQLMMESPNNKVFAISMKDKFANHGLISYIAIKFTNDVMIITDWLMSCRVFSRTLEYLIFNYLIEYAIKDGISIIQITFNPTAKNKVMEGTFEKIGFHCTGKKPEGPWQYRINSSKKLDCYIELLDTEHSVILEEDR